MFDIALISTFHSEIGQCNSDELFKILESIKPDVIFEELPSDLFYRLYSRNETLDEPPEIKSIRRYLKNRNIKHIPVDIAVNSSLTAREVAYMLNAFQKYTSYKVLEAKQKLLIEQRGFPFLNSTKWSELFEQKKLMEENLLQHDIHRDILVRIYELFYEEHDLRETQMLNNIYSYSRENKYDQGVFLIGAGHRNAVLQKIAIREAKESPQLTWTYYC